MRFDRVIGVNKGQGKGVGSDYKIDLDVLSSKIGTENRYEVTSIYLEIGCWMTLSIEGEDRANTLKLVHKKIKFWLRHNLRSIADYNYYLLDVDFSESITREARPANNAYWITDVTLILKKPLISFNILRPEIQEFCNQYQKHLLDIVPTGVEFHQRRKGFKSRRTVEEINSLK